MASPPPIPDFELADKQYKLTCDDATVAPATKAQLKQELLEAVRKDSMLPFYESLCDAQGWPKDASLVAAMQATNEEVLQSVAAKIEDAKENAGDTEVLDGMLLKAEHFSRIGDKAAALLAYEECYKKTVGAAGRVDNLLAVIRVALFHGDVNLASEKCEAAQVEVDKGGEWERRNKLRVYKGIVRLLRRDLKGASEFFISALATFTATELVTFRQFITYVVITCMVSQDRQVNKEKVVNCPEVLSVIHEIPHLKEFMLALHECKYAVFMQELPGVLDAVKGDRCMSRQFRYIMRQLRLNAYKQFLTSYKSVTLAAMSSAFGVSEQFIDEEVAAFIGAGQIPCKINKVRGVIESKEEDSRTDDYLQVIKQGDLLLAKMQKLSKVIDM